MNQEKLPLWSMSLLITGNVLGVGVLALPIKTGLSGFFPTVLSIIAIWGLMCFTALIIAKRITPEASTLHFDIPSFFIKEIGHFTKWIVIAANLLILYGVITAYLSMIGLTVASLLPHTISIKAIICIYFVILLVMVGFGMRLLRHSNTVIIIAIWLSFLVLTILSAKVFKPHLLTEVSWKALPFGLPVIVSAFHFHNIVPTVCGQLKFKYKLIRRAILQGTVIGLVINLVWVTLVLGALPLHSASHLNLTYAASHGEPATVPLAFDLHSHMFTLFSLIFALLAVTASYMANSTGLIGFIRDLTSTYLKTSNRFLVWVLAFAPPLLIALINPSIFLRAIGIVGGVGEIILFGLLPGLILLKYARRGEGEAPIKKIIAYLILAVSLFILCVAIYQQV